MPQNPEHVYHQGPFELIERYDAHQLFGRYVPASEDNPRAEYHVEVHHDHQVVFWAASYLPVDDLPVDEVGAAEAHLHDDALAYAHELIDSGAQPSDEPYRRRAAAPGR